MGPHRLLFRLLTVAALTKQDYDEHHPTIANSAVFDSRIDPIEFDTDKIEIPIITVYTEDDRATLLNRGAGRGAYTRKIVMRVDMAVASFTKTVVDAGTQVEFSLPETDAELEATLDIFEGQFWRALNTTGRPISDKWQQIVRAVDVTDSRPSREAKGNNRLAGRSLTMTCDIAQDCIPRVDTFTPEKRKALEEWAKQPALYPEAPYLTPMLQALPNSPDMLGLLDVLHNTPILLPRLKTMSVDQRLFTDSTQFNNLLVNPRKPGRRPGDTQSIWIFPHDASN